MARITLKGSPIETVGSLPSLGSQAPDFVLTRADMSDVDLASFAGKALILNIVPSLDTGICATSARTFERQAAGLTDTVVLTVSMDLPYAQKRFCQAEGISNVVTLSCFRHRSFGTDWGVEIATGPMAGLMSRAVVVLDRSHRVVHTQQVPEIATEPDYEGALKALAAVL